jgi:hypothetical protein
VFLELLLPKEDNERETVREVGTVLKREMARISEHYEKFILAVEDNLKRLALF